MPARRPGSQATMSEGLFSPTVMELGPKRSSLLWLLGLNSIIVVCVDPLGIIRVLNTLKVIIWFPTAIIQLNGSL